MFGKPCPAGSTSPLPSFFCSDADHICYRLQSRNIRDIELDVENMGANINAYTSRETTAYYARCIGRDMSKAMDVLGDMVMHSKLERDAIIKERDVILREAKEVCLLC